MILEWWQIILFLLITGIWSEWRNRRGFLHGYIEGARDECINKSSKTIQAIIDSFEKSEERYKIEMAMVFRIFFLLDRNGVLRFDDNGYVYGYNKKPVSLEELDRQLMK